LCESDALFPNDFGEDLFLPVLFFSVLANRLAGKSILKT